jgi:predicted GIY-YIG superfamily endonuclease
MIGIIGATCCRTICQSYRLRFERSEKFPTADAKVNLFPALSDIRDAIAREKQLKKWSRSKKIVLINRLNPNWLDLGSDVLQDI